MASSHGFEYLFTIRKPTTAALAHRTIQCSDPDVLPFSFSADVQCGETMLKATIELALSDMNFASSWGRVTCEFDDRSIPEPSVPPESYAHITFNVPVRGYLEEVTPKVPGRGGIMVDDSALHIDLDLSNVQVSVPVFIEEQTIVARFSEMEADDVSISATVSPCELTDFIGPSIVSNANVPESRSYHLENYLSFEVSSDPEGAALEIIGCDPYENKMMFKQLIQVQFDFSVTIERTVIFIVYSKISYELGETSINLLMGSIEVETCEVQEDSQPDWEDVQERLEAIPGFDTILQGEPVIEWILRYIPDTVKETLPEDIEIRLPDLQGGFGEQLRSSFSDLPDVVLFRPEAAMQVSSLSARLKPEFIWIGINGAESPPGSVRLYDEFLPFMVSVSTNALKNKIDPKVEDERTRYNNSGDNFVDDHKVTLKELSVALGNGKFIVTYKCEVAVDCWFDPTLEGTVEFIVSGITLDGEIVFTVQWSDNEHKSYAEDVIETVSGIIVEAIRSTQLIDPRIELQDQNETILSLIFLDVEATSLGITVWGGIDIGGPACQARQKDEITIVSVGVGNRAEEWERAEIIAVRLKEMGLIYSSNIAISLMEQGKLHIRNAKIVMDQGGRKTLQMLDEKGDVIPVDKCPRFDYGQELERQVRRSMWRVSRGGRWGQFTEEGVGY